VVRSMYGLRFTDRAPRPRVLRQLRICRGFTELKESQPTHPLAVSLHHPSTIMHPISPGPILALLPLIGATSILNHLNPAYVPALGLVILATKQWLFPPLLRPLSKPEATSRLKFNLFVLLHMAILIFVFPPYLSIKRGLVWYVDEYLQGRRGGQKSWATSGVQSAGT
jgi:hypothetical protein